MKIIGSDYDGTLNHGGIDERKKNAIKKWRSQGNIFALISGRGKKDIIEIADRKAFECDFFIANNGAVIMTPEKEVISDIRCDGKILKELIKLLFDSGCTICFVQTDTLTRVFPTEEECTEEYDCSYSEFSVTDDFNQVSTYTNSVEESTKVVEIIKNAFCGKLNPLQNGICIDIVRADMDKAKGLYILMDIVGAKYDDIIAVGDNINDKDMIREFRSYAMENGVDYIKELADFTTLGIAELIERELSQDK